MYGDAFMAVASLANMFAAPRSLFCMLYVGVLSSV